MTSATPDSSITWIGFILNFRSKIRDNIKIPTSCQSVCDKKAVTESVTIPVDQKAVTRMLTPAAAIMAITAGRRVARMPCKRLILRYFR